MAALLARTLAQQARRGVQATAVRYTPKKIDGHLFLTLSKLLKSNDHSTRKYCGLRSQEDPTYVSLGKEDFDDVIPMFKDYFMPFEPISLGLGANWEDRKEYYEQLIMHNLESGFCIGVINHEGKLIGIQLGNNIKKGGHFKFDSEGNKLVAQTIEILDHVERNYDVFSKQGVNEVLDISLGTVDPKCRGQRILKKPTEILHQKAIEKGIKLAIGIGTGIHSQQNGIDLGYVKVYEAQYKIFDFLNLKAMRDNTSIQMFIKKLV